jgi:hypothetical protein
MPSTRTAASRDNATTDIAALKAQEAKQAKKKSRGKSLGPGGLEALTESSGNAGKVSWTAPCLDTDSALLTAL